MFTSSKHMVKQGLKVVQRSIEPLWSFIRGIAMDGCNLPSQTMDLDILDKLIKRKVCKLKKQNINLEVFDADDIEYGDVLGKGGEGIVQKCIVTYNGLQIDGAVKTMINSSDDAVDITLEEIELLCLAKDQIMDHILHVYGVAAVPKKDEQDVGHLAIITEAGIMNALQLYQEQDIPLYVTLDLWSRIAGAVHCLHAKKIIHQDLKPENILVTGVRRDSIGQIERIDFKIIDLGMGKRVFTKKITSDDILGTNGYHAPEVLFEESYDFRADIFMLGITFCIMLHSRRFLRSNRLQLLLKDLHAAKHRRLLGKALYESVMESSIENNTDIPPCIKTMLCNMIERLNRRTSSLTDVAYLCRREAEKEDRRLSLLPPQLAPCFSCQDSGFGSGPDLTSANDEAPSNTSNSSSKGGSRPRKSRKKSKGKVFRTAQRKRKLSITSEPECESERQPCKQARRGTRSYTVP